MNKDTLEMLQQQVKFQSRMAEELSGKLLLKNMKDKLYYLFFISALAQIFLAINFGYFLYFTSFVSLITGLIYMAFSRKGLLISPILVVIKFLLSSAIIYVTFQTVRIFFESVLPYLSLALKPHFKWTQFGWYTVGMPLTVDLVLIVISTFVLFLGLFTAREKQNPVM